MKLAHVNANAAGKTVIAVVDKLKSLVVVAAFLFALAACVPPVVVDPDPTPPPVPTPVVTTNSVTGSWVGQLRSNLNAFVEIKAVLQEDNGVVTGTIEFVDEILPTFGSVTGTVELVSGEDPPREISLVVVVTDGSETITFVIVGVVEGGTLTGTFSGILDSNGAITLVRSE